MTVQQVYELTNNALKASIGTGPILEQDLSNVVDMGNEVLATSDIQGAFITSLVDQITKIIVKDKVYKGRVPSVLRDSWEYGTVVEKIRFTMPEASADQTWNLQDQQEYKQDTFHMPKVNVKFFNGKTTFNIPFSIPDVQLKPAFQNGTQMGAFVSGLYTAVENGMKKRLENLIRSTINNFIAETIYDEYPDADYSTKSGTRAINILKLYNDTFSTTLTKKACWYDKEFFRFAITYMQTIYDRMQELTVLYNVGGVETQSTAESLHVVTLSEFQRSAENYLESDTYHKEFLKMPKSEIVSFWQGEGTKFDTESTSKIHVKHDGHTVELDGIVCVMFDHDALGVMQENRRSTSHYNAAAEFTNFWAKADAHYFNDMNENGVVFFIA